MHQIRETTRSKDGLLWRPRNDGCVVGVPLKPRQSILHATRNLSFRLVKTPGKTKNPVVTKMVQTPKNYFASSNPHPPHSRAYDRERSCVNSSIVVRVAWGLIHLSARQTPLVCELISRTQTSAPFTKAKPLPKRNPKGD